MPGDTDFYHRLFSPKLRKELEKRAVRAENPRSRLTKDYFLQLTIPHSSINVLLYYLLIKDAFLEDTKRIPEGFPTKILSIKLISTRFGMHESRLKRAKQMLENVFLIKERPIKKYKDLTLDYERFVDYLDYFVQEFTEKENNISPFKDLLVNLLKLKTFQRFLLVDETHFRNKQKIGTFLYYLASKIASFLWSLEYMDNFATELIEQIAQIREPNVKMKYNLLKGLARWLESKKQAFLGAYQTTWERHIENNLKRYVPESVRKSYEELFRSSTNLELIIDIFKSKEAIEFLHNWKYKIEEKIDKEKIEEYLGDFYTDVFDYLISSFIKATPPLREMALSTTLSAAIGPLIKYIQDNLETDKELQKIIEENLKSLVEKKEETKEIARIRNKNRE